MLLYRPAAGCCSAVADAAAQTPCGRSGYAGAKKDLADNLSQLQVRLMLMLLLVLLPVLTLVMLLALLRLLVLTVSPCRCRTWT